MSVGYKGNLSTSAGAFYAPNIAKKVPETWESYLRRLGNGLNGVMGAGAKTTFSEENIVANAQEYMQKKYPGNYTVEHYYNAKAGKFDLRLKFKDSKEELMWKLRWS